LGSPRTSAIGQSPSALTQPLGAVRTTMTFHAGCEFFAVCNLGAFLLGTVGGFGSLIALGGFAAIRSYSRLCVFIAFFAFGALGFLVDRALMHPRLAHRRGMANALLFAVLALGLLGPNPATASPDHTKTESRLPRRQSVRTEHRAGRAAGVNDLSVALRAVSGITQHRAHGRVQSGPWVSALAGIAVELRRDEGTSRRPVAEGNANLPTSAMVVRLRQAGFAGIYLDRSGYPDGGGGIEALLRQAVGPPALASNARELAFYPLVPLPPIAP